MIRQAHLMAVVVRAFLIGCAVLLVVGCAGTRSEAPQEERQGYTEATREEQGSSPKAAAEAEECAGMRTVDVLKRAGVDKVFDSSVQPGDPEARFTTNDLPGCPNGGLLEGTDKSDKLAGEYGEDEVRALGAKDTLSGGSGGDVLYGGPGNDELQAGAGPVGVEPFTDSSKNTLHGGAGKDFLAGAEGNDVLYGGEGDDKMFWGGGGEDVLYGGAGNDKWLWGDAGEDVLHSEDGDGYLDGKGGQRDELYCGEGKDEYDADKTDYVSSTCEKKVKRGP